MKKFIKQKSHKKHKRAWILGVVFLLIFIVNLTSCGTDVPEESAPSAQDVVETPAPPEEPDEPTDEPAAPPEEPDEPAAHSEESIPAEEPAEAEQATVGDTLEVQPGLFLTVNEIRTTTEGFITPDGIYLIIDATYENTSDSDIAVSTMLNLGVRDSEGFTYNISIGTDTRGSLDGTVPASDIMRGEVAFDVPADAIIEYFLYEALFGGVSRWRI